MKMNFKGLVSLYTLPKTTPLLPLYEAVINSIQSIEDAHITNGKIEIVIEREKLYEELEECGRGLMEYKISKGLSPFLLIRGKIAISRQPLLFIYML